MLPVEAIIKKREGLHLSAQEVEWFFKSYQAGQVTDYQMSSFLMAVYFRGLNDEETSTLARVMTYSGEVVDLKHIPAVKVDKHSTGGVGDKVSLSLVPLVASLGVYVPMICGRGLGHTGGTVDKLESCPGFSTSIDLARYKQQVERMGAVMIGQTQEIAPLDKRLYALRDVTATVESIPLIACSIMSKKLAEGIDALLLDVKVGQGAFMRRIEDARQLAQCMIDMGKKQGKKVIALITQMNQPLGRMIGNALEWKEATDMLKGVGEADYIHCVKIQAAEMLLLAGLSKSHEQAFSLIDKAIASGQAIEKWKEIIVAQGGDPSYVDTPNRLHPAEVIIEVKAPRTGYIKSILTRELGFLSVQMGAGRARQEDVIDYAVGFEVLKKIGDSVGLHEPIAIVHARTPFQAEHMAKSIISCFVIDDEPCKKLSLVLDRLD